MKRNRSEAAKLGWERRRAKAARRKTPLGQLEQAVMRAQLRRLVKSAEYANALLRALSDGITPRCPRSRGWRGMCADIAK